MNEKRDGLALVVGGLFIIALVFAAYNYFMGATDGEESYSVSPKEPSCTCICEWEGCK